MSPTDRLARLTGGLHEIQDVAPDDAVSIVVTYADGTLTATIKVDGVATNPTSVKLQDAGATFGIKRTDTDAAVVASGTAMTNQSTGVYTYVLTEPAPSLTYFYSVAAVVDGTTYYETGYIHGGDLTSLATYMDAAIIGLTNAPEDLVHQQEAYFFEDFCLKTEVWLHEYATVTVKDQAEYDFVVPDDTGVIRLKSLEIEQYAPQFYPLLPGATSVTLTVAPAQDGDALVMRFILAPKNGRMTAPSWLLNRYGRGIQDGVLGYLFGMAGTPWFNVNRSVLHMERYEDAICRARAEHFDRRLNEARVYIPINTF